MSEVTIEKAKFDALLQKMLKTPPLPKSEVRVEKPKPKKKRKKPAA
jgi:hypothetical protein